MKPQHPQSEPKAAFETARLAQDVEDQAGEDNVFPWLLMHQTLVQAATRGCKFGLKAAVQRAHAQRN